MRVLHICCNLAGSKVFPQLFGELHGLGLEKEIFVPERRAKDVGKNMPEGVSTHVELTVRASDMLLFFRDPISAKPTEPNEMNLLRICDVHNIPVATNIATAEVLIHGLEHGDLDWRTILNPQH